MSRQLALCCGLGEVMLLVLLLLSSSLIQLSNGHSVEQQQQQQEQNKNKKNSVDNCVGFVSKVMSRFKKQSAFGKINKELSKFEPGGVQKSLRDIHDIYLRESRKPNLLHNPDRDATDLLAIYNQLEQQRTILNQSDWSSYDLFCGQQSSWEFQFLDKLYECYLGDSGELPDSPMAQVHQFLRAEHLANCSPMHGVYFERALALVDNGTLSYIDESLGRVVELLVERTQIAKPQAELTNRARLALIRGHQRMDERQARELILEAFKRSEFEPHQHLGFLLVDEPMARQLTNELLFKPCVFLTRKLDLALESAALDLDYLDQAVAENRLSKQQAAALEENFFKRASDQQQMFTRWAQWISCEKLLNMDQKSFSKELHRVALKMRPPG